MQLGRLGDNREIFTKDDGERLVQVCHQSAIHQTIIQYPTSRTKTIYCSSGRVSWDPQRGHFMGWGSAASCRCLVASCQVESLCKATVAMENDLKWRRVEVLLGQWQWSINGEISHCHVWSPDGIFHGFYHSLMMFLTLAHWISRKAFSPTPNKTGVTRSAWVWGQEKPGADIAIYIDLHSAGQCGCDLQFSKRNTLPKTEVEDWISRFRVRGLCYLLCH